MQSATSCEPPAAEDNSAQPGTNVLMKRIPSESTVTHCAKHRHVPTFATTWERSQSAANIDASMLPDGEDEQPNTNTSTEQQAGGARDSSASTVSGQVRNYWDLPSAISHEDDKQRGNSQFGNKKRYETENEMSQDGEPKLGDTSEQHGGSTQSAFTGVDSRSDAEFLNTFGQLQQAGSNQTQSIIGTYVSAEELSDVRANAHRAVSCNVMLATSTSSAEGEYESDSRITFVAAPEQETSPKSTLFDLGSNASSADNLDDSDASRVNLPADLVSHLHGTQLFGGANLNLAAADSGNSQTSTTNDAVFELPRASASCVEMVFMTKPGNVRH